MLGIKKKVNNGEKPMKDEPISNSDSFDDDIDKEGIVEEGVQDEDEQKPKEEKRDVALITSTTLLQDGSFQSVVVSSFQFGLVGKPYGRFSLE